MVLRTDQFDECLLTLEGALHQLDHHHAGTLEYDIFLSAVIKNYELAVELAGKLVRKALKPYFGEPLHVARLHYADVFREAVRFGLLDAEWSNRWLRYRSNSSRTAHDYCAEFADTLLPLMPAFLRRLAGVVRASQSKFGFRRMNIQPFILNELEPIFCQWIPPWQVWLYGSRHGGITTQVAILTCFSEIPNTPTWSSAAWKTSQKLCAMVRYRCPSIFQIRHAQSSPTGR